MGMIRAFVMVIFANVILASVILASVILASPVTAQDVPQLFCRSKAPVWELDLLGNVAQFRFNERTIDYDIVETTIAQPGPWPVALTLLSRNDTAIALVRDMGGFAVDILTQHRGLPVVLSGPCVRG